MGNDKYVLKLKGSAKLSNYALDKFVAPKLSELTECNIPDMSNHFGQADHWVTNFILNSILRIPVEPKPKQYIIFFLRRAEAAFREYQNARRTLVAYVKYGREKGSVYFEALFHVEICIAQMWQAFDQTTKFTKNASGENDKLYERGDGSVYERLNSLYNISRHIGSNIPEDSNLPIWLTNESVEARDTKISFSELAKLLGEIGDWADKLSNLPVPTAGN